ncbi:hypothetical protein D3875_17840 [Deinococcus cavernae]|uniref:Uncharacterized protein n=1 Tax=Deinococcus cavernae TaxID=2320857 RepID=A0A418VAH5_9DEIO|nr:hypothetical protein [Deinococcus cavernae]RJF73131.1 hypothetical protein D3875_17840 [Deinococcus cavernae]
MKRTLLALSVVACATQASAANYAPVLWNYVQGKAPTKPLVDTARQGNYDVVQRMWIGAKNVAAEGLMTIYLPAFSTDHWMVGIIRPKGTTGEYAGSKTLKFVKVMKDGSGRGDTMNLYEIIGGLFDGMYIADGMTDEGGGKKGRLIMLMTPQIAEVELNPQKFMQKK